MAIHAPADGKFRMTWHDDLVTAVLAVTSTMADPALRKYDTAIRQTRKDASNVLAEHPTLKDLLPTSDQWHLYNLTSGIPCKTEKLLSELIDCLLEAAQRTGIKRAVQTCDKLLTDAAERKLPGYDLTFFDGLKLSERWDIAPGLYAIPYRTLQKQLRRDVAPVYDPIAFRMDSQGEKSITVLVSELRWGPVIVSSKGRTLKDPYPVEMILTCNHNPLLLVALLTVTLNHPLTLLANTLRAMPWVEDFLHVRGGSCSYFAAEDRLGSHNLAEPNAEIRQVAEQVFRDWGSLSSADRDTLALAITRLSTSLSRSGMLAAQDRVLDISIALEILYRLDHGEITYKLSTRAGWYLGNDIDERLRIRKAISDFYSSRSAIVHGGKATESGPDRHAHVPALETARKTLLKHLARGSVPDEPDWPKIVMGIENSAER